MVPTSSIFEIADTLVTPVVASKGYVKICTDAAELSTKMTQTLAKAGVTVAEVMGEVREEQVDLQRALAATPDDTFIAPVLSKLREAAQVAASLNEQARRIDADMLAKKSAIEKTALELKNQLGAGLAAQEGSDDAARMVDLTGKARAALERFLSQATAVKIDRLSDAITESFRFLLRKKTMVFRIQIDPKTFSITLLDSNGGAILRHQLSEGEKQIFAVSVLWGLARSSTRPLPAVIDTPMARLDTSHRSHLVERYFPHASHQVIILSTDTEVDREYYRTLQPYIARVYHLDYDEESRVTTGKEGYFWPSDESSKIGRVA